MPSLNGNWSDLVSDTALLESDDDAMESDDESDDEDDESDDDAEFDPVTLGAAAMLANRFRGRRRVHRARPSSYSSSIRGKSESIVRTPEGELRLPLPGRFVTVDEFKKSAAAIRKDMSTNSAGIKDLGENQKRDAARFDALAKQFKRNLKQQKRGQMITIGLTVLELCYFAYQHSNQPQVTP